MASRYAVASGNWSAPGTWDGGTLPANNDVVYSNGFTVTVDQDVTCDFLANGSLASPVIVAGGSFAVSTNRSITCTGAITSAVAANSLIVQTGNGTTLTITSPSVQGGSSAAIAMNSSSNLVVNGDVNGSPSGNFPGVTKASGTNGGNWTINGNVTAYAGHGISYTSGVILGTLTVNGNVTGSDTTAGRNGINQVSGGVHVVVTGTAKPGSQGSSHGVYTDRGSYSTTVDTAEGAAGSGFSTAIYNASIQSGGAKVQVRRMIAGANGQMPVFGCVRMDPSATSQLILRDTNLSQFGYKPLCRRIRGIGESL